MGDHAVIISASNAGARMSQIFTNQFVTSVLLSLAASSRLQLPLSDQFARSLSVLRVISRDGSQLRIVSQAIRLPEKDTERVQADVTLHDSTRCDGVEHRHRLRHRVGSSLLRCIEVDTNMYLK